MCADFLCDVTSKTQKFSVTEKLSVSTREKWKQAHDKYIFFLVNDSVERLKEEKDGIVLCPQRRSFGTGCHVQTTLSYVRQLSVPERDDTKGERDRDRDR